MDTEKSVLVAVRSRPLLAKLDEEYNPGLIFTENEVAIQDKGFSFDYVFPPDTTNLQVYNTAVESRLPRIFEGYNLTIFAYGQTGSGKTYTMGTNYPSAIQNESGIIYLSVNAIFEDIKQRNSEYEFTVNVSFLEVYKEDVYDLLSKEKKSPLCQIREDFDGVKVVNLTESHVKSVDEVLSVLEQGCQSRSTASTAMNAHSSRSHSLFILSIEQRSKENFETKKSKFQLVDLAGSERVDQSKTEGIRFKEGVDINRGLLALGKVISALSDGKSHIPYRDSRLTRLLMDSLGGNSYTVMIACISPALSNSDETVSTLRYASRARKIKNKPVINNDPPEVQIQKLKQQVEILRAQVYKKASSLENTSGLEEYSDLKEQNKNLKNEKHKYIARISMLNEQLSKGENTLKMMKEKINALYMQIQSCINKCELNDSPITVDDLKAIEQEFKGLVLESFVNLHLTKKDQDEDKNLVVPDVENISSDIDTSDGDNSDLEIADIERKLEKVDLQLLKKQEIAELIEVLNNAADDSPNQNINVLQEKIDILMKEKNELEEALKNSEKKLHEERNKRYKECQSEIKALEEKILKNKILKKVKEESKLKIENLQREIQNLKSMKVKLLKKMKTENDNFRRLQIAKDREVEKLKKNERKKEFEILKIKNTFDKQVNAFKQKIEKYQSLTKRLNEALSRQKNSQIILKDRKIPKSNMEFWLTKEIEVEALKRLASKEYTAAKENMGHLTVEAHNIKNSSSEANGENNSSSLVLLNLEVEKFGLQKPIQDGASSESIERWKTISSMIDAKTALAVLFDKCVEDYMKTNTDTGVNAPPEEKDIDTHKEEFENERKNLLSQIKFLKEKMSSMKKDYESKIEKEKCEQSVRVIQCLKDMSDLNKFCVQNVNSDSPLFEKIESQFHAQEAEIELLKQKIEDYNKLREELEYWKEDSRKLRGSKRRRYMGDYTRKSGIPADDTNSMMYEYLEEDADDSFQIHDDFKDPDWRATPVAKQRKRTIHRMQDFSEKKSEESEDSELPPAKRSFSGCSCPGDCKTMRCACKKKMKLCDSSCNCNHGVCVNFTSQESS